MSARSLGTPSENAPPDMVWVPPGTFSMGAAAAERYPEEGPPRQVRVDGFWIDRAPVTNAGFATFVEATDHVTTAEVCPSSEDFPGVPAEQLVPGSAVFRRHDRPVDLREPGLWWRWVPGASWRHPEGPGSDLDGRQDHPVVHVSHADAAAFAAWAGKKLATEAEWERAARGGLEGATYAWGSGFRPGGALMANVWEGEFPWEHRRGAPGTMPVGSYPANGFGLVDVTGNVWEWTDDLYRVGQQAPAKPCCGPPEGTVAAPRVIKGGSYLCAPNYCWRYRPSARLPQPPGDPTGHLGFRCVRAGDA